jgi:hypothetical protein
VPPAVGEKVILTGPVEAEETVIVPFTVRFEAL